MGTERGTSSWVALLTGILIDCRQGVLTVTTSSQKDRLVSFLAAVDDSWKLSDEEMKKISETGLKKHGRKYWDAQFAESDKALEAAAAARA